MKNLRGAVLSLAISACVSFPSRAAPHSYIDSVDAVGAIQKLDNLKQNLDILLYYSERVDQGRLLVMERQVNNVKTLIQTKALGNVQVLSGYQLLVITLNSKVFLHAIETADDSSAVEAVITLTQQIAKDCGFEDQYVGQLLANILTQMHNLNSQICGQEIPENISKWLMGDLNRALGNALAAAKAHGDVPSSYQAAKVVHDMLVAKYDELFKISPKSFAYGIITELVGQNEFFQDLYTRGTIR